ncbi:TetR/AcrR family transcriptional regulator [Pseudovibrio ascidiaceicola]|uniref:TetR/AcrR family transcriptional regulator n=1 Tax=Pseudovibrio ascidiaceicola TaxID=285279 RepID=UPI003D361D13
MSTDQNKPEALAHIIEEVMDDCIRVFVLKGLDACSMEDFYEACGPHRAYVEQHFTTKHEFCAAVMLWWLNSIFAELKSTISLHSNLHSAIEAVLYEFIDICVGHRESKHGDTAFPLNYDAYPVALKKFQHSSSVKRLQISPMASIS